MKALPEALHYHRSGRSGWLRAAVLGVNDGIVSTSSLMVGVSVASSDTHAVLTAGIAGLVAGALSMAAGEYVSVSSQRDAQAADLAMEAQSLIDNPEAELTELAMIYESRGLKPELALLMAQHMHEHDALAAHAREEIGIDPAAMASPSAAAFASASAFAIGAAVPIAAALLARNNFGSVAIISASLVALALFGGIGAGIGGGSRLRAAMRVLSGGALAMALTAVIGRLLGPSL